MALILFPYLQIFSHLSLFMMALYQIKQKCHLTTPSWNRNKVTLNRTVLPLRPLQKTRTAEMQLKDNRIKVTEELRKKLSLIVAWNPMTGWNKIPSHTPLATQEKSEPASLRVELSPQAREHNPVCCPRKSPRIVPGQCQVGRWQGSLCRELDLLWSRQGHGTGIKLQCLKSLS